MKIKYLTFITINLTFLVIAISLLYLSSSNLIHKNDANLSELTEKNSIELEATKTPKKIIKGVIEHSFFSSVLNSGLTSKQIFSFTEALHHSVDFINGFKDGTPYLIVLDNNIDKINSFFYEKNNRIHTIKTGVNGNYYNNLGVNLSSNKMILPTQRPFRISSHFSTKRKHPVIGVIQAHLGTDYATPVGTPVMSIAKGIILKSEYHPLAGNFITIAHDSGIKTRYLHLNNRYVNKGDHVYKGEIIGKSGNSGRTTGSHLHFEYIVNNIHKDFTKSYYKVESELKKIK